MLSRLHLALNVPLPHKLPYCGAVHRADLRLCLPSVDTASALLGEYDAGHRAAAASQAAKGFGGALTANEWAASAHQEPLLNAVRALSDAATKQQGSLETIAEGRLMLGICAGDATEGIKTLKAWVTALGLPKGPLHGMDKDGVPLDMRDFGAVYIKYNSCPSNSVDPPGSALLSGYTGDFRGVYFSPVLPDGLFRQYAVLPLNLFTADLPIELTAAATVDGAPSTRAPPAARAVSSVNAGSNSRSGGSVGQQRMAVAANAAPLTVEDASKMLRELPLLLEFATLGITMQLIAATADGLVSIAYDGPPRMRKAVEVQLRAALRATDGRVLRVELVERAEGQAESEV